MLELEVFLKKLPSNKFYASTFYKNYFSALELFWFQKRKDALAFIAKIIAENIEHEDIQIFYRLWIEIAAETHDRLTLKMLKNHLATLAPQFEDYDQWAALRGLVHFELEELDACAVILRGVGENKYSSYAMELKQRYDFRFAQDGCAKLSILSSKGPIHDYFILQSLAQGALANGNTEILPKLLSKISQVFPLSPLPQQFHFWEHFENNNLVEAIELGKILEKKFPQNERFKFDLGYALLCNNKVSEGIKTLESLGLKSIRHDPDTMALLGFGYLLESKDQKKSKAWEKAKSYFTLAKSQADKLGIPSSELLINLHFMEEQKKSQTDIDKASFWALPLSPRRESELMRGTEQGCLGTEQDINFLFHEVDLGVQDSDFVFLTAMNIRALSLYKVIKKGVWHPYLKNQALLELVLMFPHSVSMPRLDADRGDLGMLKLNHAEVEAWLNRIEEFAPIRQKIKAPAKKEHAKQLRQVS